MRQRRLRYLGALATSLVWQCGAPNTNCHDGWGQPEPLPGRDHIHGLPGFRTERPWDPGSEPHCMAAQSGDTCVLMLHYIIGPTGSIMNMMMMMRVDDFVFLRRDRPLFSLSISLHCTRRWRNTETERDEMHTRLMLGAHLPTNADETV